MTSQIELTYKELRARLPSAPLKILQRLGHDPVTGRALACDGVEGDATRRAIYLNPDAVTTGVALAALGELLRGAQEEEGKNDGPDVHKYARKRGPYIKGADLWAWCALFASWCLWQVWASFEKVSGAVRLVRDYLTQVQPHELKPDDLVAWWSATRGRPYGHVGIVAALTQDRQWCWTIEGNVDLVGRIDGVAARRLKMPSLTRADGSPLACCGRHVASALHAPSYAALKPGHQELDEMCEDDDHCA
jgi:hypothetical protein